MNMYTRLEQQPRNPGPKLELNGRGFNTKRVGPKTQPLAYGVSPFFVKHLRNQAATLGLQVVILGGIGSLQFNVSFPVTVNVSPPESDGLQDNMYMEFIG